MNETTSRGSLVGRLAGLADPTRTRLLQVLDSHELAVSELCAAVQLPQSTVSRHLRTLAEEGWVVSRAEGTSRFYRVEPALGGAARVIWDALRGELAGDHEAAQDEARARAVVARRRSPAQDFFASAADRWDALRTDLFGGGPELAALPALLDADWTVGDLGCGTGRLAELLAPFVGRVVGVDRSVEMLGAAGARLTDAANVDLRLGELEALPVTDGELDAALVFLVLHYVPDPPAALAEAARALRPGGRLLVVDMIRHGREDLRDAMGHLWQGFTREQVLGWLEEAGFEAPRWTPLPPDPQATGPVLFAASARRRIRTGRTTENSAAGRGNPRRLRLK